MPLLTPSALSRIASVISRKPPFGTAYTWTSGRSNGMTRATNWDWMRLSSRLGFLRRVPDRYIVLPL